MEKYKKVIDNFLNELEKADLQTNYNELPNERDKHLYEVIRKCRDKLMDVYNVIGDDGTWVPNSIELINITKNSRLVNNLGKTLIEANRCSDIIDILCHIAYGDLLGSIPIHGGFVDEIGELQFYVDGRKVRKEAKLLIKFIIDDDIHLIPDYEDFKNLYKYVHSETDVRLHNYAIGVTHRSEPDDIDEIRSWCVLDNLIVNLPTDDCIDWEWEIPDGWKKK